jgi:hypothetical protein
MKKFDGSQITIAIKKLLRGIVFEMSRVAQQ